MIIIRTIVILGSALPLASLITFLTDLTVLSADISAGSTQNIYRCLKLETKPKLVEACINNRGGYEQK